MSQQVYIPTKIEAAADSENTRYALGAVYVNPGPNGTVFLAATDARILAVVKSKGDIDKPSLIPQDVLPKNPKQREEPLLLDGNEWKNKFGRYGYAIEGRFPRYAEVFPKCGGRIALRIDPKLLMKIAEATGSENGSLTLLIETNSKCPEGPVGILGTEGVGVIMPLAAENGGRTDREKYAERVAEIQKAYVGQPKPGAAKEPPPKSKRKSAAQKPVKTRKRK